MTWYFTFQTCVLWGPSMEPKNIAPQKTPKQDLVLDIWAHLWNYVLLYFSLPTFNLSC